MRQLDTGLQLKMLRQVHQLLSTARPGQILFLSLLVLALIGIVDYITGYEISTSVFYLIPIALASWYASRRYAIAISILCAIVWGYIDSSSGHPYTHAWIPYWNAFVRFGFFLVVMSLLTTLKLNLAREERLSRTEDRKSVV